MHYFVIKGGGLHFKEYHSRYKRVCTHWFVLIIQLFREYSPGVTYAEVFLSKYNINTVITIDSAWTCVQLSETFCQLWAELSPLTRCSLTFLAGMWKGYGGGEGFQIRPEVQMLGDDDRNCAQMIKSTKSVSICSASSSAAFLKGAVIYLISACFAWYRSCFLWPCEVNQYQVLKTVPACTLGLSRLIAHRRSEKKKKTKNCKWKAAFESLKGMFDEYLGHWSAPSSLFVLNQRQIPSPLTESSLMRDTSCCTSFSSEHLCLMWTSGLAVCSFPSNPSLNEGASLCPFLPLLIRRYTN